MKVIRELLFAKPAIYLATCNGVVRHWGEKRVLVMGAGAAKAMKQRFPEAPDVLGRCVATKPNYAGQVEFGHSLHKYGLVIWDGKFGAFQTKYHFTKDSTLELIEFSVECLTEHAKNNPSHQFRLNFPGIGYGHLRPDEVQPLLTSLPDNVTICLR